MRTVQLQQTDVAALVAKGDQLLVQNLDPQRQILQLIREADRLPEATHVLAARRAGTDMGELAVLLRHVPVEVGAIPRLQKRSSGSHRGSPFHHQLTLGRNGEANACSAWVLRAAPYRMPSFVPSWTSGALACWPRGRRNRPWLRRNSPLSPSP